MTPEEKEKLDRLCKGIVEEKDPLRFQQLVIELNSLLDAKDERINSTHRTVQ
jgi:hypothetical protein